MTPTNLHFKFPEVRVVEASAGSGKTYALAYRYVQLLFHLFLAGKELPLRRILAITFTNKAALEMKGRIIMILKKIALGEINDDITGQILRPFGLEPETGRETARKLMDEIIRQYHFFKVQTIDEFINSIIVGCAFRMGLTANFKIRTDANAYLEYSLDELIDNAAVRKDTMRLFSEFIDHYLYLENRAGWFPKRAMAGIIGGLFSMYNKYALDFVPTPVTSADIVSCKSKVLEQMKALKPLLPPDCRLSKTLVKFLEQNPNGFDLDALGVTFANEDIDLPKKVEITGEMETRWATIRLLLRRIAEDEAGGLFNPYLYIFRETHELLKQKTSRDDIVLLDQLNSKACTLFDKSGMTVEELYYRLAARYEHYLIDEFQDTSRLQWRNLAVMPEEALSQGGGSLFYVGDKKQAIYRFRGGDAHLFDDVKAQLQAFPVNTDLLAKNWRSEKTIVEWNNAVFAQDNLRLFIKNKEDNEKERKLRHPVRFSAEETDKALSAFKNSRQEAKPESDKGYVHVQYVDGDKKEDRDALTRERVVETVNALKERFALQDITILTRKNREVELVTRWLMEEGWMVNSERTSDVRLHKLIQEIVAFLTFLDCPVDNLSFSRFILGDLFAAASGRERSHWENFIIDNRESLRKREGAHLYIELREKYPEIWERCIEKYFKNVGLYPLYELLVGFYEDYGCLKRFPDAQGFFIHFLDLVKRQENECPDMREFLVFFEELEGDDAYVKIAEPKAIRVMTVHKAKGLQFPVVILPFFGMEVEPGVQMGTQSANYVYRFKKEGMALVRLKKKYYDFSPVLYQIYREEYQEAFAAELNNLYVALTRAQYEMYIFIPAKVGNSLNIAQSLIPQDMFEKGTLSAYPQSRQAVDTDIRVIMPAVYHDWVDFIAEEFAVNDSLKRKEQKRLGRAMHALLSYINNCDGIDIKSVVEAACRSLSDIYTADELDFSAQKVIQIVGRPELEEIFFCADKEVMTEQEIITAAGHSRRIDRLIVGKDDVWVIDYKSTASVTAKEEDRNQLEEYLKLCGNIFPGKKIKGSLLFLDNFELINSN